MSTDAERFHEDGQKNLDSLLQLVQTMEQTINEQRQELESANQTIEDLRRDVADESLKNERLREHLLAIKAADVAAVGARQARTNLITRRLSHIETPEQP